MKTQPQPKIGKYLLIFLVFLIVTYVCFTLFKANQENLNKIKDLSAKVAQLESTEANSQINSLKLSYDKSKFEMTKGTTIYQGNGLETDLSLPSIKFTLNDDPKKITILEIVDFSSKETISDPALYLTMWDDTTGPTELRPVIIDGKKYAFSRYFFGEGGSTTENCYAGGSTNDDIIYLTDRKVGIKVTDRQSETGCGNEKPTITKTPADKKTIEEILNIVESIKFSD